MSHITISAIFPDDQVEKQLCVTEFGDCVPTVPEGPEYNNYKYSIHARIIDKLGGSTSYHIANVTVSNHIIFYDITESCNCKLSSLL